MRPTPRLEVGLPVREPVARQTAQFDASAQATTALEFPGPRGREDSELSATIAPPSHKVVAVGPPVQPWERTCRVVSTGEHATATR